MIIIFLLCSSCKGTDYSDDSDYIDDKGDKISEGEKTEKKKKKKNGKLSRREADKYGREEDIRMSLLRKVFKITKIVENSIHFDILEHF